MSWSNPNAPNLGDFNLFVQNYMGIPVGYLPLIPAPAAPVLSLGSGGSLGTETVYVKVTYVSPQGETTPSAEASIAVTGPSGQVIVAPPAGALGAVGWNAYAATATGAETLQNAAPLALGAGYTINTVTTGAALPTMNTTLNPWVVWSYPQALNLVLNIPCVAGLDYTLAVYNCAGHILIATAQPPQPGQDWFAGQRQTYNLLLPSAGVVESSSDQGTSNSLAVPDAIRQLMIGDLQYMKTPWGRAFLAFQQDFGGVWGLS